MSQRQRGLFAPSSNRCAFPNCTAALVTEGVVTAAPLSPRNAWALIALARVFARALIAVTTQESSISTSSMA
jgi:hypothetical protein